MTDSELIDREARLIAERRHVERTVKTLRASVNAVVRQHQDFAGLLSRYAGNPTEKSQSFAPLSGELKSLHQALPSAAEVARLIDDLLAEYSKLEQIRADLDTL